MAKSQDWTLDRSLPSNVEAERMVLGSILVSPDSFTQAAGILKSDDFSLDKHRRIFLRMAELNARGAAIDRVTLANELMSHQQLESCDGLTYLSSLDEGMPQIPSIESYCRIVKERAARRSLIFAAQESIIALMDTGEEFTKIAGSLATRAQTIDQESTSDIEAETLSQYLERSEGGVNAFLSPPEKDHGILTLFPKFDDLIDGLHRGRLYIIGGDAGIGKSACALNIAMNIASQSCSVVYFSIEMSKDEQYKRMLCATGEVPYSKLRHSYNWLSPVERLRLHKALSVVAEYPLYIDESSSVTMPDLYRKSSYLVHKLGARLVVVDYVQLMDWYSDRTMKARDEREALTIITRSCKLMARKLDVPVILVSQLNRLRGKRAGKDLRPKLSDLLASGSLERDADLVMLLYREEFDHPEQESLKGTAEWIIAKQRAGARGTIKMRFDGSYIRFREDADGDKSPYDGKSAAGGGEE
jgi:replicative DNA helicase